MRLTDRHDALQVTGVVGGELAQPLVPLRGQGVDGRGCGALGARENEARCVGVLQENGLSKGRAEPAYLEAGPPLSAFPADSAMAPAAHRPSGEVLTRR